MKLTIISVLLTSAAPAVVASPPPLEEMVITANLREQTVFDVLGAANVITHAELSKQQPGNLPEALEHQSGIQVGRNGGKATQTSLFTRGTNSNHTLVLFNGIRVNSATVGQTALQFVDPIQIDRVEFVKGSRSAIYGSDAIGGVLQVFTNSPPRQQQGYVTLQNGSLSTRRVAGGVSNHQGNSYYSLALSRELSDGIDNLVDDTGFNSDDDPYGITSGNVSAGVNFGDAINLSLTHLGTRSNVHYDSIYSGTSSQPYSRNQQSVTGLTLDAAFTPLYTSQITLANSQDRSKDLDLQNPSEQTRFDTERHTAYWLNTLSLSSALTLDAGLDHTEERVSSTSNYQTTTGETVRERSNTALFTQLEWRRNHFSILTGVRRDDNKSFGEQTSANVAIGYKVDEHVRLYATWGEGFKAPTFNDLYWPDSGNPNLMPEISTTREVGVKGLWRQGSFTLSGYQTSVDNLIDWAPGSDGAWRPTNISQADIKGAELEIIFRQNDWTLYTTLSHIDAVDAISDEPLQGRARKKITTRLSRDFEANNLGLYFRAESERLTSTGSYLPGYGVLGLYATATITDNLSLKTRVDNITNKSYQIDERYNQDELNISSQLTYQW